MSSEPPSSSADLLRRNRICAPPQTAISLQGRKLFSCIDQRVIPEEFCGLSAGHCGLTHKTDEQMREKIEGLSLSAAAAIDFTDLAITDLHKSLTDDITWLRQHPLIKEGTTITGLVYNIDEALMFAFRYKNSFVYKNAVTHPVSAICLSGAYPFKELC
ncbi:hypothetical protein BJ170DRAFT_591820 [Xylariales sp. AK1849]|nr:hypothetical protein BJ170DRAFT_591820 [Xylariales sp. AK1849]